jgi:hypothetical protein
MGSYTILALFFFMKIQIFSALSKYEGRKNSYEAFLNKNCTFWIPGLLARLFFLMAQKWWAALDVDFLGLVVSGSIVGLVVPKLLWSPGVACGILWWVEHAFLPRLIETMLFTNYSAIVIIYPIDWLNNNIIPMCSSF